MGANGDDDGALAALKAALAGATSDDEQGRAHRELAMHFGARGQYRWMNHHERASAEAHARSRPALAAALARYEQGVAVFSSQGDPAEGIALLRSARAVIVDELTMAHPFAQQVTNTLAGRLRSIEGGIRERLALFRELTSARERLYGPGHPMILDDVATIGHLLRSVGEVREALAHLERAFDGLVAARRPRDAGRILVPLVETCLSLGDTTSIERREEALLACDPPGPYVVRTTRLLRMAPRDRWRFASGCVVHVAEHVPRLSAVLRETVAHLDRDQVKAARRLFDGVKAQPVASDAEGQAVRAMDALFAVRTGRASAPEDAAFHALEVVLEAELDGQPEPPGRLEPETGPLAAAEESWQHALLVEVWTNRER